MESLTSVIYYVIRMCITLDMCNACVQRMSDISWNWVVKQKLFLRDINLPHTIYISNNSKLLHIFQMLIYNLYMSKYRGVDILIYYLPNLR